MFEKGNYVVCSKNGVCVVEDIGTPEFLAASKGKSYFILRPVYNPAGKLYIPVETAEEKMRLAMTAKEANELIEAMPGIEILSVTNEKFREETYKACMMKTESREWVKVLKTTYDRRVKRTQAGRKVTSLDHKYMKIAEDTLYGEMALALGLSKNEVEEYITKQLG